MAASTSSYYIWWNILSWNISLVRESEIKCRISSVHINIIFVKCANTYIYRYWQDFTYRQFVTEIHNTRSICSLCLSLAWPSHWYMYSTTTYMWHTYAAFTVGVCMVECVPCNFSVFFRYIRPHSVTIAQCALSLPMYIT